MSYRLEAEESLPEGIRRIATEQLDKAAEQLRDGEDRDEAVHEARKHFKKIRAVLRLVRDEIGEDVYKPENVCYRDAGRRLAPIRDSFVKVETLDMVTAHFSETLAPDAFAALRQTLVQQHDEIKQLLLNEEQAADKVLTTLNESRGRIADWPITHEGVKVFRKGLRRVYKRGQNRLADAQAEPDVDVLHEWRKRVKYLWYHMRILEPIWSEILNPLADVIHDLSDYLGDYHDLAVLRQTLVDDPNICLDDQTTQHLIGLIERYQAELQAAAWWPGEHIYVEPREAFVDRISAYWKAWQREQARKIDCLPETV
jgi:CHAD domain-containing protein